MQPPNTRRVLVSVAEAAIRLDISQTEVRRQVKAGKLEAESFDRPQGSFIRVVFYEPEDAPTPTALENESTRQDTPDAADLIRAAIDPYVAMNERIGELYAGAIAENADLRERVGRAEERANAAEARAAHLAEDLERAQRPWWRRLPW
jgi:hypothetical protein